MGYTHYFHRQEEIESRIMNGIVKDFKVILPALKESEVDGDGLVLCGGDGKGKPEITPELVCFNGTDKDDLSHETFHFPRVMTGISNSKDRDTGLLFEFCKTARKPYDIAVTAFLVIAKHHLGDYIAISSDGDIEDWDEGIDICKDSLGYGADFQLREED